MVEPRNTGEGGAVDSQRGQQSVVGLLPWRDARVDMRSGEGTQKKRLQMNGRVPKKKDALEESWGAPVKEKNGSGEELRGWGGKRNKPRKRGRQNRSLGKIRDMYISVMQ